MIKKTTKLFTNFNNLDEIEQNKIVSIIRKREETVDKIDNIFILNTKMNKHLKNMVLKELNIDQNILTKEEFDYELMLDVLIEQQKEYETNKAILFRSFIENYYNGEPVLNWAFFEE